jgi:hypothetical protein
MKTSLRIEQVMPTALLLAAGTLATILAACGGGGYGGGSGGSASAMGCSAQYGGSCPAPSVALVAPGTTVNRTIALAATASAASGLTVMRVEFFVDGTSVGTASAAPYTVNWETTTVSDGQHQITVTVTDSSGKSTTSPPFTVTVANNPAFSVTLSPSQIVPAPTSSASGSASLTVKLANGAASGSVTVTGVTATAVTINQAFAGDSGSSLITLTASGTTAGQWNVPAGATLSAAQITALLQGELYVLVKSAANPGGEIRGQITPANVTVVFATLAGSQEVPPVTTAAAGVAAVTVDSSAATVTVQLHDSGITDATAAALDTAASGATGPQLVALTQDAADATHWSVELAKIGATDLGNFKANMWYVNVLTSTDPAGQIRAQIDASATPPPPPVPTLTQLTTTVFAVCGACHTGGGASLPASMNLTAGHIYASIVNVHSVEQPALLRVKPGDPTDSYVVQKLEGAATISGARMPFGGPYLSQAQINQLAAWISAGAPNN